MLLSTLWQAGTEVSPCWGCSQLWCEEQCGTLASSLGEQSSGAAFYHVGRARVLAWGVGCCKELRDKSAGVHCGRSKPPAAAWGFHLAHELLSQPRGAAQCLTLTLGPAAVRLLNRISYLLLSTVSLSQQIFAAALS